jgi:FtsZ-binding cell division protein ZapB
MRKSYHKLEEVEKKDVEMIKSLQDRMGELQEQNKQLQLQCLIGKDALHTGNKTLKNSATVKKPELIK